MKNHADEHEAFAASRSSEHVYVPIDDRNYTTLDKHAETIEMDAKLPLVLIGEPGIGKNALLSNWVKRRGATKHRDEFLFQYFAGASTRAKQLPHMLHKLETALKEFFQLREMDVPSSEERLIWSLNRFLAAAAKKYYPARIVIVIDGVFAIKGLEMPAGALHWLPTELPAGVRFIVSTIATTDKGKPSKPHRTYLELLRRNCPVVMMEAMNDECQEAIIGAFTRMHPNEIYLTKEQIKRIIHLEVQSKPMYLRTLLYALRQGVALGTHKSASTFPAQACTSTSGVGEAIRASSGALVTYDSSAESVRVPDELLDMYLSSQDSTSLTSKVLHLLRREEKVTKAHGHTRLLAKNYKCLLLMCERHPAHSKALVDELEVKLEQDERLVQEVYARFREECSEKQACQSDCVSIKKAIQERAALQQEMLVTRYRQHETLQRGNATSSERLSQLNLSMSTEDGASTKRHKAHALLGQLRERGAGEGGEEGGAEGWEEARALIRASTGIADPDVFIEKHLNCDQLESQMMELKQVSESRLSDLKREMSQLEEELEQTRYNSLSIGGNKEARDLHQRLNEGQVRLKRSKERSDAMENLQRHTVSGLRHICDLLGAPEPEDDTHVAEMVHQLEFILDSLVDEKDRSTQKRGEGANGRHVPQTVAGHGSTNSVSDGSSQLSLEISISRPAEIEAALQQFVSPKVRVAQQLIGPRGKSERDAASAFPDIESLTVEEEVAGVFVPNREAVKAKSAKTFRAEQRKQARLQKTTVCV